MQGGGDPMIMYKLGPYQDTWSWDGITWRAEATSPFIDNSGVARHAAAYDAASKKVVLFGGYEMGIDSYSEEWRRVPVNETGLWNGDSWAPASATSSFLNGTFYVGPPARTSHSMAYDAKHQQVVPFGGDTNFASVLTNPIVPGPYIGGGVLNDTWLWSAGPAPLPSADFNISSSPFVYDPTTLSYVGKVIVKNVSSGIIEGPFTSCSRISRPTSLP
jgi:hypothetical protein